MSQAVAAGSVAIVVVTHQGPDGPVRACLQSLHEHRSPHVVATLVVDNGAVTRGVAHRNNEYGPGCFTVIRTTNHGYGAAINLATTHVASGADAKTTAPSGKPGIIVVVNDDVTVSADWLDPLIAAFDEPWVGAVQPKLLFAESGLVNSLGVAIGPDGSGRDIASGQPDSGWVSGPIEMFTGGAVALSSSFLDDVGGFDERYFLYYEDVDLALRGAERGWTYRCEVGSVVRHHGGVSTASLGDELRRLQERNRLWTAFRFGDAGRVRRACWLSIRRLRHRPRSAHRTGFLQGLAAAPRLLRARRRGLGST